MNNLMLAINEMFSLPFMVYAAVAGVLISLCSSLLGVTLVLKRYSMIGDGLSHVAFGALAVATALGATPLYVAIPAVMIASFFLLRLNEKGGVKGDALTAMISTGALAIGAVSISLSKGTNIDLSSYMFGSILTLSHADLLLSCLLAAVVIPAYFLLYNKIFAITFDPEFAMASGVPIGIYDTVLALLTSLTVVLGMRFMGTLLISALIVFPPLISMRVCKSFKGVVITSALLPIFSFLSGLMLSYFCSTPPGASVVCVNLILFAAFSVIGKIKTKTR